MKSTAILTTVLGAGGVLSRADHGAMNLDTCFCYIFRSSIGFRNSVIRFNDRNSDRPNHHIIRIDREQNALTTSIGIIAPPDRSVIFLISAPNTRKRQNTDKGFVGNNNPSICTFAQKTTEAAESSSEESTSAATAEITTEAGQFTTETTTAVEETTTENETTVEAATESETTTAEAATTTDTTTGVFTTQESSTVATAAEETTIDPDECDNTIIMPSAQSSHDDPTDRRPDVSYGSFPSDTPLPSKPTQPSTRALAPDLLRGLLMLLMAMDHMALALNTWAHGTGRETEMDGVPIKRWNRTPAYIIRTLTHLCAPGFTMLLGIGVVYLGRSRKKLGWSSGRIARYFFIRAFVLTAVNVVLGWVVTVGKVWFMNFVLFSLAVDYLLAGLLWVAMDFTEPWLAKQIPSKSSDESEVLLGGSESSDFGETVSWHVHNALLAVLGVVTIWWNIWLSPTHGHCTVDDHSSSLTILSAGQPGATDSPAISHNPWFGIWFWTTLTERVQSVFPPMAWVSFAILGLLYARIDVARTWNSRVAALCNTAAGIFFLIIFVLTRVLHFGNLSEGCLQTPEHIAHPDQNQYLVSVQSFFYIMKYPPDVAFWAFTLAGNLLLLAVFGGIPTSVARRFTMLLDFGRAALFFYLAHLFFVFIFGGVMVGWFGHETENHGQMDPDSKRGIDNVFAYLAIWGLSMLLLWPLVRWYGRFKATKPADSIWRFF
ncbi:hypothetical protein LB505_010573 [Fusarium chuoi]|nr:hypothetical protein LB505_010573 [Fusarium chuoi]